MRASLPLHPLFIALMSIVLVCARLWHSFFTAVAQQNHSCEEAAPQPCASILLTLLTQGTCILYLKNTCGLRKEHASFMAMSYVVSLSEVSLGGSLLVKVAGKW